MDASKASELGAFQAGDHSEDPPLFGPGQLRLKSNDIIKDAFLVFASQLDDGMRLATRPRVDQSYGFHRPVGEGLAPPTGDRLDGETPLEAFDLFKGVQGDLLGVLQGLPEIFIGLPIQRAVQVIRLAAAVAGSREDTVLIDGLPFDDRRNRIVEIEVGAAGERSDRVVQACRR